MSSTDLYYRPKAMAQAQVDPIPSDRMEEPDDEADSVPHSYTATRGVAFSEWRPISVEAKYFSDVSADLLLRCYQDLPLHTSSTWAATTSLLMRRLDSASTSETLLPLIGALVGLLGTGVLPELPRLLDIGRPGEDEYGAPPVEWGRLSASDETMLRVATRVDYSQVEVIPRFEDDD